MFYQSGRFLVTGGAGFLGTHFVRALLARGARVRASVHQRPMLVRDGGIELVPADLTRIADCRMLCKGIDHVIHAAGGVAAAGVSGSAAIASITLNLALTAQMMQAASETSVRTFLLFGSSTGYPAADHPLKEEEMWSGPPHAAYFGYGWMRRYLERMGEFVASKSGMGIAIVRPTAIYGRHDNFDPRTGHVIPALIRRAVAREDPFEVWGTGDEVRDFLHVSDFVRGSLLTLEKYAVCDPVNIGYGGTVTIKDVVRIILRAAQQENVRIVFDPAKPTAIPVRRVDTSKARRLLGFQPEVSLEAGLADTVAWFRENYAKPGNNR